MFLKILTPILSFYHRYFLIYSNFQYSGEFGILPSGGTSETVKQIEQMCYSWNWILLSLLRILL